MLDAAAYQRHIRSGLCQRARDATGDAGAAAGYERDSVFENSICED